MGLFGPEQPKREEPTNQELAVSEFFSLPVEKQTYPNAMAINRKYKANNLEKATDWLIKARDNDLDKIKKARDLQLPNLPEGETVVSPGNVGILKSRPDLAPMRTSNVPEPFGQISLPREPARPATLEDILSQLPPELAPRIIDVASQTLDQVPNIRYQPQLAAFGPAALANLPTEIAMGERIPKRLIEDISGQMTRTPDLASFESGREKIWATRSPITGLPQTEVSSAPTLTPEQLAFMELSPEEKKKAILEGRKTSVNIGLPGETAGKMAVADSAIRALKRAQVALFPDGKLDMKLLGAMNPPLIGELLGGVSSEGRKIRTDVMEGLEARYRASTGAAGNMLEWRNLLSRYMPSVVLDSSNNGASALHKLKILQYFLERMQFYVDPTGVYHTGIPEKDITNLEKAALEDVSLQAETTDIENKISVQSIDEKMKTNEEEIKRLREKLGGGGR